MCIHHRRLSRIISKLKPPLRTSRGAEEVAADNSQLVLSTTRKVIIFIFYCILDTTNMVKT